MKAIAVFAAILAVSTASPQVFLNNGYGLGYGYPLHHTGLTYSAAPVIAAPVVPVATKTQYHAQDELGQASFGHSEPTQSHSAVRDAAGGVRGTFSYIGAEGIPFTTHYIADHNGYRVASNALPVAPSVAIAGPVDTPEVQAAKAQHAAAHAEALVRTGRKKRGVLTYNATPYVHSGAVFGAPAVYSNQFISAPALTYAAAPVARHVVSAPALTYSAVPVASHVVSAPAVTYSAAPVASHVVSAPAATVVSAQATRLATLTKVVNTPGHAVSYRVD